MADSIAVKVAQKAMTVAHASRLREGTPIRVAARYMEARVMWDPDRMDGKIVGKDARLYWNDYMFVVQELPQKGKKKLKVAFFSHDFRINQHGYFMPQNLLRDAKIGSSDDYKAMKAKIDKAWDKALKEAEDDRAKARFGEVPSWVKKKDWNEDDVFYLHVRPEGVDPFTVMGKDFTLTVKWDEFHAYSPTSDFQQADPHYTKIKQKSPGAARKLYKVLKSNPDALRSVSWTDFNKWLDKNKIGYDYHFSQWG